MAPTAKAPRAVAVEWMGERALMIHVADEPGPEAARRAGAVADALMAAAPPALQEVVPAYTSVLALLDPFALAHDVEPARARRAVTAVARRALRALSTGVGAATGRTWRVAVRYGGADGPDLSAVAAWAGRSPEEVVAIHAATEYSVLAVGFRPGYPYLGFVDDRIAAPRLDSPRARVEAGSVGIAGRQTGIYARASSGGWQIIGRTDFVLFDPDATVPDEACRMHVGDRVRFVPEGGGR